MNKIHYIKAHYFNSTNSACLLATKGSKHLAFAKNLIEAKMSHHNLSPVKKYKYTKMKNSLGMLAGCCVKKYRSTREDELKNINPDNSLPPMATKLQVDSSSINLNLLPWFVMGKITRNFNIEDFEKFYQSGVYSKSNHDATIVNLIKWVKDPSSLKGENRLLAANKIIDCIRKKNSHFDLTGSPLTSLPNLSRLHFLKSISLDDPGHVAYSDTYSHKISYFPESLIRITFNGVLEKKEGTKIISFFSVLK